MTQNVNVKYNLSEAGQKAALLAGRNASQTVTETMTFDNPALLDVLTIGSDGSLSIDASAAYAPGYRYYPEATLKLDAPPANLADLVAARAAHRARIDALYAAEQAEAERAEAERKAAADIKAAADSPIVDALLAELEALDPLAAPPAGVEINFYGEIKRDGYTYSAAKEQTDRAMALYRAHQAAEEAAAKAAAEAKQAEIDRIVAERGGHVFPVEAGMCTFRGYGLWSRRQSRRWVGVFTQPKGIDRFLDSPRGEFTWDIESLSAGTCIQGGGFDTNSRGKRRDETEWFGVVVSVAEAEIVVRLCGNRTEALQASRKQLAAARG